jgi:hypothetical protein
LDMTTARTLLTSSSSLSSAASSGADLNYLAGVDHRAQLE